MGAADLVPGVSGGTVALLFGFYDLLLESLKTFRLRVLVPLGLGMGLSLFGLAHVLRPLLETQGLYALFFGMIAATIALFFARERPQSLPQWGILSLGLLLALFLSGLSVSTADTASMGWLFVCGIFASGVMLLPGISGSYLLCVLGVYPLVIQALSAWEFSVLLPLGGGILLGLALFSRLIRLLLAHARGLTLAFFLGMMCGGLRALWPGFSLALVLYALLGAFGVIFLELSFASKKFQDNS